MGLLVLALLLMAGVAFVAMAILVGAVVITGLRLPSDRADLPWSRAWRIAWFLVTVTTATIYAVLLSQGTSEEDGWRNFPDLTYIAALLVVGTAPALGALYLEPRKYALPAALELATFLVLVLAGEYAAAAVVSLCVYVILPIPAIATYFDIEAARRTTPEGKEKPPRKGFMYWFGGVLVVLVVVAFFPFGDLVFWLLFPKARVRKRKEPPEAMQPQLPAAAAPIRPRL